MQETKTEIPNTGKNKYVKTFFIQKKHLSLLPIQFCDFCDYLIFHFKRG